MLDYSTEQWRPVVGYEGWYEVSDLGRVRRVASFRRTKPGGTRKPRRSGRGYYVIRLHVNKHIDMLTVHGMVARAFCEERPSPAHEPNHKDGDRTNNAASNLEWTTRSENILHAYRLGLATPHGAVGERNGRAKLTNQDVKAIRALRGTVSGRVLAKRYDVGLTAIYDVLSSRKWQK